jgi:hypothetical protein
MKKDRNPYIKDRKVKVKGNTKITTTDWKGGAQSTVVETNRKKKEPIK